MLTTITATEALTRPRARSAHATPASPAPNLCAAPAAVAVPGAGRNPTGRGRFRERSAGPTLLSLVTLAAVSLAALALPDIVLSVAFVILMIACGFTSVQRITSVHRRRLENHETS